MESLEVNQRLFTLLCICPSRQPIKKIEQIRNIICSITIAIFLVWSFGGSFVAFSKFMMNNNLEEALYALIQVAGIGSGVYLYASAFLMRSDITELFDCFQEMYDSCECVL